MAVATRIAWPPDIGQPTDSESDEPHHRRNPQEPGMATTDLTDSSKRDGRPTAQQGGDGAEEDGNNGTSRARRRPARRTSADTSTRAAKVRRDRSGREADDSGDQFDRPGGRQVDFDAGDAPNAGRRILQQLREGLLDEQPDQWVRPEAAGERIAALTAVGLLDELEGDLETARQRIASVPRSKLVDAGLHLLRRTALARWVEGADEAAEELDSALRSARQQLDGPQTSIAGIDHLLFRWRRGEAAAELADAVSKELGPTADGSLTHWARSRLASDLALEQGDIAGAMGDLDRRSGGYVEAADVSAMDDESRFNAGSLWSRHLVLAHLAGHSSQAFDRLREALAQQDGPDSAPSAGWEDFAVWLARSADRHTDAATLILDNQSAFESERMALAAYGHAVDTPTGELGTEAAEPPPEDRSALGEALLSVAETSSHPRVWEAMARRLATREPTDAAGHETVDLLIRCLNRMVEHPTSDEEEATLLVELGDVYRQRAGMTGAAAEVYREALDVRPTDGPARRALKQLYRQQGAHEELVDLLEHELAHDCASSTPATRRRAARLCLTQLGEPRRAAGHVSALLETAPTDPEGLRLSRECASDLGNWQTYVGQLERAAEQVASGERRLDLLERAATTVVNRLDDRSRAIRGWRRVRSEQPGHRRAFRQLGRLYEQAGDHDSRAALLQEQAAYLRKYPDELSNAARLWLEAGGVCVDHLDDLQGAREAFMRALALDPDCEEAARKAVHLFGRTGNWSGLVALARQRVQWVDSPVRAAEELTQLAEWARLEFDRTFDALDLYREAHTLLPDEPTAKQRRIDVVERRLLEQLEQWEELTSKTRKLARNGEASWGQVATLAEFRLDDPAMALEAYLEALGDAPSESNWLHGIRRNWRAADADPGALAERLQSILTDVDDPAARDELFKTIARLVELDTGDVADSHGFRAHGDLDNPENMTAVRIAMARTGDRQSLERARLRQPAGESAAAFDRLRQGERVDLSELPGADELDAGERRYLLGTLPPADRIVGPLALSGTDELTNSDKMRAEIAALHTGEEISFPECPADGEADSFPRWRLHALAADAPQRRAACMIAEIRCRSMTDPVVDRWCDLLEMVASTGVFQDRRAEFERRALGCAFPDAFDESASPEKGDRARIGGVSEPTARRLVELVDDGGDAQRLRRALEAFLGHDGLGEDQRVDILTRLSEVCAERLGDFDGARSALEHAWRANEAPEFLEKLVALDERAGDPESALDHRRRHYQELIHADDTPAGEIARSGYDLAQWLDKCGRRPDAIGQLEDLRASFRDFHESLDVSDDIYLDLAELHVEEGAPKNAAEVLEELLEMETHAEARASLVDLYANPLDRPERAYDLQFETILEDPTDDIAVERLIDLAARADRLEACASRLVDEAESASGRAEFELRTAAGRIADEELMETRRAAELYGRALERNQQADEKVDARSRREALRSRGFCLARLAGSEQEALSILRRLIAEEPAETTTLRAMLELFERTREHDRIRLAKQGLNALGCATDVDSVRSKLRPSRALEMETLDEHLLPDALADGVFEILETTLPIVADIVDAKPAERTAISGIETRRPERESPVDRAARAVETAVGAGRLDVELGDIGSIEAVSGPATFDPQSGRVLIDEQWARRADRPAIQFSLARLGAAHAAGLTPLTAVGAERVMEVLEAVWRYQCEEPLRPGAAAPAEELTAAISSPLMTVTRRRVISAIEPHREALIDADAADWTRATARFAGRLGLVLTGDLETAIQVSLNLDDADGDTLESVDANNVLSDLMAYAFGDGYRHARYALGLGGRPSQMRL